MSFSKERFMDEQNGDLEEKISKEIIWNLIKINDEKYFGFDMHEVDEESRNHNFKLLIKFEDYIKDVVEVRKNLRFWKGSGWLSNGIDEQDFNGWTTVDILYWLIHNSEQFLKLPEIEEEERRLEAEADRMRELAKKIQIQIISRVITPKDRYEVCKRQHWKCNFCGETLRYGKKSNWEGQVAHIDHIHPFSKKETYPNGAKNINESSNLQALCPKCNLTKSKKEIN